MTQKRGFTLLELLVVLAIIALLSVLAIVSLDNIREKARDTKRLSDMAALQTAMATLKSEEGGYDKSGCPADNLVSDCVGNTTKLSTYLPSASNLKDPLSSGNCAANCVLGCNYAFTAVNGDNYAVAFYLENGAGSFKEPGCYKLDENNIQKQ